MPPNDKLKLDIRKSPFSTLLPDKLPTAEELRTQRYGSHIANFFQQVGAADLYRAAGNLQRYQQELVTVKTKEGDVTGTSVHQRFEGAKHPFGEPELQRRVSAMTELSEKYGMPSYTTDPKLGKKGLLGMVAKGWDQASGGRPHYLPSIKGSKSQIYIPQSQYSDPKETSEIARANLQSSTGIEWSQPYWDEDDKPHSMGHELKITRAERTMLEELAHSRQQVQQTKGWKSGTRNPLQIAMTAIGQPLTSLTEKVGNITKWNKTAQKLHKASQWLAGYERPGALEYEAHGEGQISSQLQQEYARLLRGSGSTGILKEDQFIR